MRSVGLGLFAISLAACTPPSDGDELGDAGTDETEESGSETTDESGTESTDDAETSTDAETETATDTTETGDINEACEPGEVPVGTYSIDVEAFPEVEAGETVADEGFVYSGQCELIAVDVADELVTIELACAHTTPEPVPVTITATGSVIPSGLEVGDTLDFDFDLGTNQGGDAEPQPYAAIYQVFYVLSDADGAVFASAASGGLGGSIYEVGPMTLTIEQCWDFEFPDDGPGYWRVTTDSQELSVADGYVEVLEQDGLVWRISNFASKIVCCHGNDVGFSVLRQ